jgi:hypothetical protein
MHPSVSSFTLCARFRLQATIIATKVSTMVGHPIFDFGDLLGQAPREKSGIPASKQ